MRTFFYLLFLYFCVFNCAYTNRAYEEHTLIIDTIPPKGIRIKEWYILIEQFISNQKCSSKKYASSYICLYEPTNDTVLVVNPCMKNRYEDNTGGILYVEDNVSKFDTVHISLPKEYSYLVKRKSKIIYGTLKIPIQ